MAKKPAGKVVETVTTTVKTEDAGGDELDLETGAAVLSPAEPDPDELDGIAKLHELSGGNVAAMYEVRRVLPSADAGYCGTLNHEEMTMERLQEEWGAGTYTVRVRLPGGKFAGSGRVQIAPLPKHKQVAAVVAPVVSAPAGTDPALAGILAGMQKSHDMMMGLVTALITKPAPVPPPAPPPPDPLAMIAALKDVLTPPRETNKSDPMEMFLKGLTMGKEIGGGDGETNFGDLALKGLDTIKDLATTQAKLPAPVRPQIAAPAAAPAAQPVQPVNPGAPPMLKLLQWLNQQVMMLVHQAERGKNPELYAELFLDNLPDFLGEEEILQRMQAPDAVQQLARVNAKVLQHAHWFDEFRRACVTILTEQAEQEEQQAADAGVIEHVGDLPPDAGGTDDGSGQ